MNTIPQTYQIVLMDGKTRIANWSQDFGDKPTIGDRIDFPDSINSIDAGYLRHAAVSRVEIVPEKGIHRIEADAESGIPAARRTVVTLNRSLIPERLRGTVETQLRNRLELPLFEWEDSFDSQPIVRLHRFDRSKEIPLTSLQAEIRKYLTEQTHPADLRAV